MKENRNILDNADLRRNPFTVPDGYFASVEDRVHERLDEMERRRLNPSPLKRVLEPVFALACTFALVYLVLIPVRHMSQNGAVRMTASAEVAESDTYRLFAEDNVSVVNISDYLETEDSFRSSLDMEFSEEEILDYLEHNVSYSFLASLYE